MKMSPLADFTLILIAYLIGSIPFGLVVSRVIGGVDIRQYGSGNIGTANVLRTVGRRAALLTLLGDMLKGFLPTLGAKFLGGSELLVAAVGLAAVLGHNWSAYLRFRGGKGVATTFAVLLAMTPLPALLGLLLYGGVLLAYRYTSLAALATSVCLPLIILLLVGVGPYFAFSVVAALLIFFRHRDNIQRLLARTEPRVGQRIR
jgi:glycerol-3-phosphate acyltransferase PlsY